MKHLLIALTSILISCGQPSHEIKKENRKGKNNEPKTSNEIIIGQKIQGDFNGDGQSEYANVNLIKEGEGNPVEDGTPDEYAITFSDHQLTTLTKGCCEIMLINEGDLNGDGSDEFSAFQWPMNGCTKSVSTYTFTRGTWEELYEPFLFSVGCGVEITNDEYMNWITLENGSVFYRLPDPNDENLLNAEGDKIIFNRLLKIKAELNK